MFKRWLSGFLIVALVPLPSFAYSLSCTALLSRQSTAPQTQSLYKSNFDYTAFTTKRDFYEQILRSGDTIDLNSISDSMSRVAFLEATSRSRGLDILDLNGIIQNGSFLQKYKLQRTVNRLDFSGGLSLKKLSNVLEDLYLLSHSASLSVQDQGVLLGTREAVSVKSIVRKRIESEIVKAELINAFEELGLIRDRGMYNRMVQWRSEHKNIENSFLTGLLNFISIHYLGLVSFIPDVQLNPRHPPPAELVAKIKSGGFDAIYEDIRPYYRNTTIFNMVWKTARVAYLSFFMAYGTIMAVQALPAFSDIVNSTTVPAAKLEQLQEKTFNADEVRNQQFDSWRQAFYEFEGRWPDPVRDKAEWEHNWDSIMSTPDGQLRVNYGVKANRNEWKVPLIYKK